MAPATAGAVVTRWPLRLALPVSRAARAGDGHHAPGRQRRSRGARTPATAGSAGIATRSCAVREIALRLAFPLDPDPVADVLVEKLPFGERALHRLRGL